MESRNKDKAVGGSKAAEAVQQLLEQLHVSGLPSDSLHMQ